MNELPPWIADERLVTFWDRVRDRFETAGLVPQGGARLTLTSREQRQAVGAVLGRTLTRPSVTIDLATLDERLRQRSGVGGIEAVLAALGRAPTDRPALRAALGQSRERPLAIAAELVQAPWAQDWIAGLRRAGVLTHRECAERRVREAATLLLDLTWSVEPTSIEPARAQSRVELGARVLGDAHALDPDRLVHQLVLRGLAAADSVPPPTSARDREALWSRFGVEPDLLSRTCLVWRLLLDDESAVGRRLALAREDGDPVHVTDWDLRRVQSSAIARGQRVLVCENPRVLEALAENGVPGWAAVCTSGEPNLVVGKVLTELAASGAQLRYHGDFDWPGIAIADRAIDRYGVMPWRMSAHDYLESVRSDGPPLLGSPLQPTWDPELGAAMRSHGHAVHEESVLGPLMQSLTTDR